MKELYYSLMGEFMQTGNMLKCYEEGNVLVEFNNYGCTIKGAGTADEAFSTK